MGEVVKIIRVDNFNRENISDTLIADNVKVFYAREFVEFLNEKFGGVDSPNFYKMVPLDHKLYVFEP